MSEPIDKQECYAVMGACFEVLLDIKACKHLEDSHRAQLMNYLRATGKRVGLLMNFGHHLKVQLERFVA